MKKIFAQSLASLALFSMSLFPQTASASQLDIIRASMADLGLFTNRQRPKIASVYMAARPELKPKAQKWLDPVVDSLRNFPVSELTSKVTKNRENQEVFRFTIKDPSGDIVMDLTPDSETQPIKINGVPMPLAAWWSERDFELFLDNVILDSELEASRSHRTKIELWVRMLLGSKAKAGEADDLWFEVTARACLAITNTADPLCDKPEGTLEIFAKNDPKIVSLKIEEAKKNILVERTSDSKEQKRLNNLIKGRIASLEKTAKKSNKLPEKKVASAMAPPEPAMNAVESSAAVVVAPPAPAPAPAPAQAPVQSVPKPAKLSAKKESKKHRQPAKEKKSAAKSSSAAPKVIALDFADIDEDLAESEAEIAAGQRHQISARELASLTEMADDGQETDSAAKVPAPVFEGAPSANDKTKSFAERRKQMSAQKVGLAIATITGMSLMTKVAVKKANAPTQNLAEPSAAETKVKLVREPTNAKKSLGKAGASVESDEAKLDENSPPLSQKQLLTPVKPRKNRGSN